MSVRIEVDPHHVNDGEVTHLGVDDVGTSDGSGLAQEEIPAVGWSPEQAGQFVVGLWNIGCVLYGPEWAADPRETAGWDYYCAQLLDQVLPRGQGGAVEMGVGLVMVGQGLMTMTMHRWPLIKRGPRPLWVRENAPQQQPQQPPSPDTVPPPPAPTSVNGEGPYQNPYVVKQIPEDPSQPWAGV